VFFPWFDNETRRVWVTDFLQTVEADGMVCEAEPSTELPLTQTYYVY
jgi:hypothetical protein